ncbi:hypothetical protein [Natrialbaceae archaeon AArc-T1-2]|uniref:hypothetical protein n=1 Tax=Natrialbaceae archaeon AArc-T1-2 TaxID=3053904 RepID=UPI00255B063C|nr:hypothetical protein [Natrialbaceae archaeon AArc-T1-2]WIV67242.1 hypothetical protein QQ977_00525 [Natrialbaceae archaeon AArc-T1-2]
MSRSSADRSDVRWFVAIVSVVWLVLTAVVIVGLPSIIPDTDAVNVAYLVSMIVFGLAVVATAVIIARLGQRATPSTQGPNRV